MICDRCGRLLNRATGKCNVCADHGGAAPPPVATREAAAGPEGVTEAPEPVRGPSRDPGEPVGGVAARGPSRDPGEPLPPAGPAPSGSVAATLRPASPYKLAPPAVPPSTPPPRPVEPPTAEVPSPRPPAAPTPHEAPRPVAPAAHEAPRPPAANVPPPRPPLPETPAPVPPPAAPEPPPLPEQPISVSAAVAILDLSDRPERKARPSSALVPLSQPAEPARPPRAPGAPVGVVRGGRLGRRRVDLVAYDGNLVIAKRGAPDNLTSGQLAGQDPSSRILTAEAVEEAIVREDAVSGQVRITLRAGDDVVVRWPGWKNRGVLAENLFAHAFPGKVDQGSPEIAKRTVRVMVGLGVSILVAVAAYLGLSALLKGDPPPPPPPAPPTTIAPAEQAARTALQQACPAWQQFSGSVPTGERPNPTALRPVVDGMRPWFVAAADAGADPFYATARDEVGYLQDYARRPVDDVARESVSRVSFAMRTVTTACDRAMGGS